MVCLKPLQAKDWSYFYVVTFLRWFRRRDFVCDSRRGISIARRRNKRVFLLLFRSGAGLRYFSQTLASPISASVVAALRDNLIVFRAGHA